MGSRRAAGGAREAIEAEDGCKKQDPRGPQSGARKLIKWLCTGRVQNTDGCLLLRYIAVKTSFHEEFTRSKFKSFHKFHKF